MQTVVETPSFIRSAKECGLCQDEVDAIKLKVAADPECGDELEGTGGFRKMRIAGRGKGKSGGYRLVTFYTGKNMPVFLVNIFAKGTKANLSAAERNELKKISKVIVAGYRSKIAQIGTTRKPSVRSKR